MGVTSERKLKFLEENFKGNKNISYIGYRDGTIEVYCHKKYFYHEIKEPLEKYGYTVYCGNKPK